MHLVFDISVPKLNQNITQQKLLLEAKLIANSISCESICPEKRFIICFAGVWYCREITKIN